MLYQKPLDDDPLKAYLATSILFGCLAEAFPSLFCRYAVGGHGISSDQRFMQGPITRYTTYSDPDPDPIPALSAILPWMAPRGCRCTEQTLWKLSSK